MGCASSDLFVYCDWMWNFLLRMQPITATEYRGRSCFQLWIWIQINLRSEYGFHVLYRTNLVLVSTPQRLGLVSVLTHSGLCHVFVLFRCLQFTTGFFQVPPSICFWPHINMTGIKEPFIHQFFIHFSVPTFLRAHILYAWCMCGSPVMAVICYAFSASLLIFLSPMGVAL